MLSGVVIELDMSKRICVMTIVDPELSICIATRAYFSALCAISADVLFNTWWHLYK